LRYQEKVLSELENVITVAKSFGESPTVLRLIE